MTSKLLFKAGDDWTQEILEKAWEEIEIIGREELKTTWYRPQIEIVTAKQMLDAYASTGMPTFYKHWSFGKEYVANEKAYTNGEMGLAYEMVINSQPCVAYLMEENGAMVQTMVMAHASVGHSSVFKNNYLFKQHTDAEFIIDYLTFARDFIKKCEERYGIDEVESVLDSCHALQRYGVDRYKKPKKPSAALEQKRAHEKFERELNEYDHVWEKIGKPTADRAKRIEKTIVSLNKAIRNLTGQSDDWPEEMLLDEPQENLLYFIEKNAPQLAEWKRELIRITRNIGTYFHPQILTKTLNEGYASFCHYYIMERLHEKGLIDGGTMLDFYGLHGNVLRQPQYAHFNPYYLGFCIFMDIKRICQGGEWKRGEWVPITAEDREYFPNLVGKDWAEQTNYAMENFSDETFIQQYLSPKVARDLQLFSIHLDANLRDYYNVVDIADQQSFYDLRNKLAAEYSVDARFPDIQIHAIDKKNSRKIYLKHHVKKNQPLNVNDARVVVEHLANLWEYSVDLQTIDPDNSDLRVTLSATGRYSGSRA